MVLAGFTRITGTATIDEDRSEVYNVSCLHPVLQRTDLDPFSLYDTIWSTKDLWLLCADRSTILPGETSSVSW